MNVMLEKLLTWSKANGTKGYDPYDIKSLNKFTRGLQVDFRSLGFFKKVIRVFLEKAEDLFPKTSRMLLGVKQKEHPTHLGCMLHAYVNLQKSGEGDYSEEINFYRDKLLKCKSSFAEEYAWGVPFTWNSGGAVFHEGTPFAVVSNWIGSAFLELYYLNKNEEDLAIAVSCCEFILNHLQITETDEGTVCFSYSPLKKDTVNNANLFAADLLLRVGKETGNENFMRMGEKSVDFSIATQLDSGLIPYYAHSENTFNDSYHGSYELQCIFRAWKILGKDDYKKAFDRYWEYYIKHYYHEGGIISKYATKKYPVDSTSLADALILFAEIKDDIDVQKYVEALLKNLEENWQSTSGYFYYKEKKRNSMVNIPYIRWTQGWMALGLSYWNE